MTKETRDLGGPPKNLDLWAEIPRAVRPTFPTQLPVSEEAEAAALELDCGGLELIAQIEGKK